jgi:hypothetical protein
VNQEKRNTLSECCNFFALLATSIAFSVQTASPEKVVAEYFRTKQKKPGSQAPFKPMQSFMVLAEARLKKIDLKYTSFELLGTVIEGAVRHALARVSLIGTNGSNTKMQVVSLKFGRDEWKVLVTSESNSMPRH